MLQELRLDEQTGDYRAIQRPSNCMTRLPGPTVLRACACGHCGYAMTLAAPAGNQIVKCPACGLVTVVNVRG